jgi:hypothetical protein
LVQNEITSLTQEFIKFLELKAQKIIVLEKTHDLKNIRKIFPLLPITIFLHEFKKGQNTIWD